jgi:hypothetical protein
MWWRRSAFKHEMADGQGIQAEGKRPMTTACFTHLFFLARIRRTEVRPDFE